MKAPAMRVAGKRNANKIRWPADLVAKARKLHEVNGLGHVAIRTRLAETINPAPSIWTIRDWIRHETRHDC